MGTREIPATFEHTCDCCGKMESSIYKSRPKYWGNLKIAQDAYDRGVSVSDGSCEWLICEDCKSDIVKAINTVFAKRVVE